MLDALARALQLDEAERGHLFDLARAANTSARPRRRPAPQRVRPGVQRILDAMDVPADLRNGRRDILAANRLGYALYNPHDRGLRNSWLRVDSSPTRSCSPRSWGLRPAAVRRFATRSLAAPSQSGKNAPPGG